MLLLQAADKDRGPILFGDSLQRVREALGEPVRAELYHAQNARVPKGWELSFFGIFRGRSEAPLRVCSYHDQELKQSHQKQLSLIADALTKAGFEAFGDTMLEQASRVFQLAPQCTDFSSKRAQFLTPSIPKRPSLVARDVARLTKKVLSWPYQSGTPSHREPDHHASAASDREHST